MKNEDAQLIDRFLAGDEDAFTLLVKKHRKGVHALAWRKVSDFHIAEEITQDTFLKAYQKLATLKNPNQFAGWLYVIADRLCIAWHRKQKPPMESLETTSGEEIEESSYRHYEDEQRVEASIEHRWRRIKDLLEKLPESERTVVTLHYLGEMTCKAIGEFLGVSPNTVKSRLQRARNRLKDQEDFVSETLGSVDLPTTFTESIMKQVANIKPAAPANSRPLIPVALSAAAAIVIFLIIGVGSQYLARFQKPYNLNARSEIKVEIIDASIVLDTQAKPDLRNQAGRFDTTGKGSGAGPQVSEPVVLAAAQVEKETRPSTKQQWIQTNGPEGGPVSSLFRNSEGDIYTVSSSGIYRLAPNAPAWILVNNTVMTAPLETSETYNWMPMAERGDTLYLVSSDEMLASTDRGRTWNSLGERPVGNAIGLAITDEAFYLALEDKGIFRSTNSGKHWTLLNDLVHGTKILAVAKIENTVFVGTTKGLYRISSGTWEKLEVDTSKAIHSLAVSESNLYVGTGLDFSQLENPERGAGYIGQLMGSDNPNSWEIFLSSDLGDTWTEITPTSNSFMIKIPQGIKVLAAGETLLALGGIGFRFRSTDGGKTWTEFGVNSFDVKSMMNLMMLSIFPAVAVTENTFLQAGTLGLTRSTDGGESWQPFMNGMIGTNIFNLIAFKNALYTNTGSAIAKSIDGGESWKTLRMDSDESTLTPIEKTIPNDLLFSPKLASSGNVLYGIASTLKTENALSIFRLSEDGNTLVPIQETPDFGRNLPLEVSETALQKASKENTADTPFTTSGFAVSGETFYVEYKRRLFRWKHGESEWFNTGLIDTGKNSDINGNSTKDLKLAVSGETVYVGKRDGHLLQSFDSGSTWKDITSNLPLRFEHFNDIIFLNSTVSLATNAGVLTSENGEHWYAITDKSGTHIIINKMTVANTTVYGVGDDSAYQLDNGNKWKQISPVAPNRIISLAINGDRLYIATKKRGIFHASLEEEQ